MRILKSALLGPYMVFALASPALCQQVEDGPNGFQFDRYVSVLGGATFAAETTPTFAGEYGEKLGEHVLAYLSYSYSENLMGERMRGNLAFAGNLLTAATGYPRSFSGRDRGLALSFGAKYLVSVSNTFRPYVGAGAGGLELRRTIIESTDGDVTASFVTESGLNDGVITSGAVATIKPIAEALVGVNMISGRTYVDVGYRFRRAFQAQSLDFSQFSVGVGVTF